MGFNQPAAKRGFHYNPVTNELGIFLNGIDVASYSETVGRTYYVNNITGSATANGRSWGTAVAEVSQAITLQIADFAIDAAAGNKYTMSKIIVQGTVTAYGVLTTLPQFCDIIGIGTDPRNHVSGVPRLGPDETAGTDGVIWTSGNGTGCNWYNMQFQAGAGKAAFSTKYIFSSHFENCAFSAAGDTSTAAATGFHLVASGRATAVTMNNCHFGTHSNKDLIRGFNLAGTHWHNCKVTNSHICGSTTGITVAASLANGQGSTFTNNYIGAGVEDCACAVHDLATAGTIVYCGNFLRASNGNILVEDYAGRWIGNIIANAYDAGAGS